MSNSIPTSTKQWNIQGKTGFDCLKFSEQPLPELGDSQCLVKIKGISLNYRDLIIPKGQYPFAVTENVIPCSDGAGTVIAVGKHVKRFAPGDNVVTLFNQSHIGGRVQPADFTSSLGGVLDGTAREYAAFPESGLAKMPTNLSFLEASTLPCAGVTAWNALFGLESRALKPGEWVLTQGTGGVSIFAVQFAKAAGAKVVATTSSEEKAVLLKKLGADHVVNYRTTPEWGSVARELTPSGLGFHHVVEVAGPTSMKQSLDAVALEGVISIIGFVGGEAKAGDEPGFGMCLAKQCIARGIFVGSRGLLEDLCRAIEANPDALRPVVDVKVFEGLEKLVDAYEYLWSQKHQGNVCIKVD